MTQKQYADMTIIMGLSRTFCDQMYKAMKNCGLIKEGFSLKLEIGDSEYGDGILQKSVELEKDISDVDSDEWERTRMDQMQLKGCGWRVHSDPLSEIGSLPPEVRRIERKGTVQFGDAEDGGKPYPVDGLWIGSDYNDCALGGGQ